MSKEIKGVKKGTHSVGWVFEAMEGNDKVGLDWELDNAYPQMIKKYGEVFSHIETACDEELPEDYSGCGGLEIVRIDKQAFVRTLIFVFDQEKIGVEY